MKQTNYRFEVYFDTDFETPEFVVKYYDLPVGGQGKTPAEAIEEAQENLKFYLEMCEEEGIKVPPPSTHNELSNLSGKLTLRVSKTLHKKIIDRAEAEDVSINSLLNEAINVYLSENKSNQQATCYVMNILNEYKSEYANEHKGDLEKASNFNYNTSYSNSATYSNKNEA